MNSKHLIIKTVTLLYQEYKQATPSEITKEICSRIIDTIKLPEVTTGLDTDRNVLSNLTSTVKRLIKNLGQEDISTADLKQQIIIDCLDDTPTRQALEAGLIEGLDEKERGSFILSLRRELQLFLREEESREILKEYYTKLTYNSDEVEDKQSYIQELLGKLEPFVSRSEYADPAIVGQFDLDDDASMEAVFKDIKNRATGMRGYRLGFQHVNKMFGGTLDDDKLVTLGALQHQHKTGTSLAFFRQILMYNIPHVSAFKEDEGKTIEEIEKENEAYVYTEDDWVLYDCPYAKRKVPVQAKKDPFRGKTPVKKPLAIRISSEDALEDNLQKLFQDIYFNVELKAVDINEWSEPEMVTYVKKHLKRNGWHARFERINPSEWTYRSIIQKVLDSEDQGYEVKVLMIDYLGMIPTTGCEQGPAGHDLRDLFRRVRNFCTSRNILLITPHQMSTDATRLLRLGTEDIVKKFPNGNYYAGSTQIAQEIDLELFLHIEKVNGVSWLTIQRGKFRSPKVGEIPEAHTYCALPFDPAGGLQDDLLLPQPLGRAQIGSTVNAAGEEETAEWLY